MKTTAIALAALMTCGVASAQNTTNDMNLNGISMRLGLAYPIDNTLRGFSESLSGIGIEFAQNGSIAKNGESYVAIDYMTKRLGEFGKGAVVPVTYNTRIYNGQGKRRTYTFFGAGVGFADFTSAETVLIARGGLGIQLSDSNFLEATGTFSAATANTGSINTIGLYFGYRF
jgi:hypothetical protein